MLSERKKTTTLYQKCVRIQYIKNNCDINNREQFWITAQLLILDKCKNNNTYL